MKNNLQIFSLIEEIKLFELQKLKEKYQQDYNKLMINNIMWNAKEHLVCIFKDYLIYDELSEFFIIFFPKEKSIKKLKDLFEYYNESSFIFPNYTPLPESKYIYKSIIKKQRVIDEQENLEELKKKQKILKEKKKNIFYDFYNDNESQSKFFNSSIYNSILKPSESLLKILFGIDKENNTKNTSYYLNKNFISNNIDNEIENEEENIIDFNNIENTEEIYDNEKEKEISEDEEQIDEIKNVIKVIHKYEKKRVNNMSIKEFLKNNKNNNNKIKIKLGLLSNKNENNNYSVINRTAMGKVGKNILSNYQSNNFIQKYIYNGNDNNSGINPKINNGIHKRNNHKKNNISIFNFKNNTKTEITENESIINNIETNKPMIITNYNFKNNNLNNRNTINLKEEKNKKVKSTFCFNEFNYYNNYLNKLNLNEKNDIYKNYYKNDFNTPIAKRTKTLDKNIKNYKLNKKDNSIININININKTNLYVNNNQNKKFYKKNKIYPKIIPKLNFNSINRNKSIKNKITKTTLNLNELKNIYNQNYTERNLNKRNTPRKNQFKINEKFKLMLGLHGINNKIGINKEKNKNNKYSTENTINSTLKININNSNFIKKKHHKISNSSNNRNKKKNNDELIGSTKVKISDYYTDRNDYFSIK